MAKKEKTPVKKRHWMTSGEILARDYASCEMARQFWSLLYGTRMKDSSRVNGNE
ncbi:TPA: hypothetical protein G8S40_002964 [Salmonella enterica]|uniref:Uncharacterized protein n=1 Tax=Salmonella enterica TaxID=28901 RepID=A0A758ALN9_SALER|nr:hypothetical protein [Salmonella enterica]